MSALITPPRPEHATPYRSGRRQGSDGFAALVRSEWTKFRTVSAWVLAIVVATAAALGLSVFLSSSAGQSCPAKLGSILQRPSTTDRSRRRARHRRLLPGPPEHGRERQHHRQGDVAHQRAPSRSRWADRRHHRALGQGGDHHHGEHRARFELRRRDGDGRPRRAPAIRLHPRHRRSGRLRLRRLTGMAAPQSLRRHRDGLRLFRRRALDDDRDGHLARPAAHGADRDVRGVA